MAWSLAISLWFVTSFSHDQHKMNKGTSWNHYLGNYGYSSNAQYDFSRLAGKVVWEKWFEGTITGCLPLGDTIVFPITTQKWIKKERGSSTPATSIFTVSLSAGKVLSKKTVGDFTLFSPLTYYNSHLFLAVYGGEAGSDVYCLHLDGSVERKFRINGSVVGPCNIIGDLLVIASQIGKSSVDVQLINVTDGHIVHATSKPVDNFAPAGALDEPIMYLTTREGVQAVNVHSLDTIWASKGEGFSLPVVAADLVAVPQAPKKVFIFDRKSGNVISSLEMKDEVTRTELSSSGILIACSAHKVIKYSCSTSRVLWEKDIDDAQGIIIGADGYVLVQKDSELVLLNNKGEEVWRLKLMTGLSVAVSASGSIVATSFDGRVFVIK